MAKTFAVKLEIEEIALGTVLRKLHDMPGIAKLDLDFGHGGQGAGKEKLQQAAAAMNTLPEEAILKALADGPMKSADLIRATGMKSHRIYYALEKLEKAGVSRKTDHGHELIQRRSAGGVALLPPPAIKHGPGGRASTGSGPILLLGILKSEHGPVPPGKLRIFLGNNGMSPKSISGVLARARRDGLIKKSGDGYVLTAKAEKNGAAHG